MNQALTTHESQRLPPVDPARPDMTPSLPQWLQRGLDRIGDRGGTPTIPADMALTEAQRKAVADRVSTLSRALTAGPWDRAGKAITMLLLAFPAAQMSEPAARARAEAYKIALEDQPAWAIEAACRAWLRSEHLTEKDNPAFAPSPPQLRRLAGIMAGKVAGQKYRLKSLLEAVVVPDVEISEDERIARMAKLTALSRSMATRPT